MNTLSNFSEFALSRGEMKKVTGGWAGRCICGNGSGFMLAAISSNDIKFFVGYYCGGSGATCTPG